MPGGFACRWRACTLWCRASAAHQVHSILSCLSRPHPQCTSLPQVKRKKFPELFFFFPPATFLILWPLLEGGWLQRAFIKTTIGHPPRRWWPADDWVSGRNDGRLRESTIECPNVLNSNPDGFDPQISFLPQSQITTLRENEKPKIKNQGPVSLRLNRNVQNLCYWCCLGHQ